MFLQLNALDLINIEESARKLMHRVYYKYNNTYTVKAH